VGFGNAFEQADQEIVQPLACGILVNENTLHFREYFRGLRGLIAPYNVFH